MALEPTGVTLVQSIANPEKFNGRLIRVVGFLRLGFEGNVLYLHREDYENAIFGNGIWGRSHTRNNQAERNPKHALRSTRRRFPFE